MVCWCYGVELLFHASCWACVHRRKIWISRELRVRHYRILARVAKQQGIHPPGPFTSHKKMFRDVGRSSCVEGTIQPISITANLTVQPVRMSIKKSNQVLHLRVCHRARWLRLPKLMISINTFGITDIAAGDGHDRSDHWMFSKCNAYQPILECDLSAVALDIELWRHAFLGQSGQVHLFWMTSLSFFAIIRGLTAWQWLKRAAWNWWVTCRTGRRVRYWYAAQSIVTRIHSSKSCLVSQFLNRLCQCDTLASVALMIWMAKSMFLMALLLVALFQGAWINTWWSSELPH